MKKLIDQLLKFGVVGGICFLIDYIIALVILKVIIAAFGGDAYNTATLIGGGVGFTVSVIANYILSFKFVFERKEDLNRKTEFVIFIVLSIIGLGVN